MTRDRGEAGRFVCVTLDPIGLGDGSLQVNHETVEIYRSKEVGPDGVEVTAVGKPARAEIPSRFGARSQASVDIRRIGAALRASLDVLAIGLVARLGPVIPIPIEKRSVGYPADAAMSLVVC
jgi:hypothetical protein